MFRSVLHDLLPENNAELEKAQKLWEARDSIFPSPPPPQALMKQPPQAPAEEAPTEEAPAKSE